MSQLGSNVNNETFSIYQGTWINWEEGLVWGAQATLSARDSQILSSFLSIFVAYVGVQLWGIISFIVHQARSTEGHSDGIHQQIQIVLRNTSGPWSATKAFFDILWSWRGHADRFFSRTVPWALLAIVYALGFGIISIFAASEITKAPGNARLIRGQYCGIYEATGNDTFSNDFWQEGQLMNEYTAAQYADSCYPGNSSASVIQCDVFRKPFIDFDKSHESTCPFGDNICYGNNSQPLAMDTGLIDSSHDLGMNTPENQRLQWRKKTTCTPLNVGPYVQKMNITTDDSPYPAAAGDLIYIYYLGPQPADSINYTLVYNTHAAIDQIGYTVSNQYAYTHTGADGLGFNPIPALNRTDADLTVTFIAGNDIQYQEPCDDPVFGAHIEEQVPFDNGQTFTSWLPDHFVSVVACAEQHQVCNPNNNVCTDLAGYWDASQQTFTKLSLNNMQEMVALRIGTTMQSSTIYNAINGRGASALQAQNSVTQLSQAPLPPNQWEIEASSWFSSGLARIQQEVQQYATRTTNVNITLPAQNAVQSQMATYQCSNQMTLFTQGTVSYSLIGLGLILCLGVFFILLGYLIEPITSLLQRVIFKRGLHKHRDWVLNEKLQLHRMVLQSRGIEPWYKTAGSVPVTERGLRFSGWEESDLAEGHKSHSNGWQAQQAPPQMEHQQHQDQYRHERNASEAAEAKPFISRKDEEDTAYYGHGGGPQIRVAEH